jgi:hypothetical protein
MSSGDKKQVEQLDWFNGYSREAGFYLYAVVYRYPMAQNPRPLGVRLEKVNGTSPVYTRETIRQALDKVREKEKKRLEQLRKKEVG